jgi:signal transduction histidine kinase
VRGAQAVRDGYVVRSSGQGLASLADGVAALDGTFTMRSQTSAGTTIRAEIPLPSLTSAREVVVGGDVI